MIKEIHELKTEKRRIFSDLRVRSAQLGLSGVSTAASEQAKRYLEETKQRGPVIEVPKGTEFTVTFDGGRN